MNEQVDAARLNSITERVIGSAFTVIKVLGKGFLEKVYENALAHECRKAGLRVEQQRRLIVMYDGIPVGEFVADMVVEDLVLIEIKAARASDSAHEAQCLNYLAATGLPICLLLNFSSRVDVRRFVGRGAPAFPPGSLVMPGPVPMTRGEEAEFGASR